MSARRVPVNAAALLVGRVVSAAAAVAVASIAAHRLDLQEFGLMASTMAAGFLINTLITFGTDTVITRAVAAQRDDAWAIARASLQLQLGTSVFFVLAAGFAYTRGVDLAVLVQALALVPLAMVTVAGAVLRGRQRMDQLLMGTTAGAVGTLAGLLIGFSLCGAPWVPIAAVGFGSSITAAVSSWFARGALIGQKSRAAVAPLLRETAPFGAMVVLAAIGAQAGLLLVEFGTDETTGGYGAAVRLTEAARLVPAAVMGAFFPAMLAGLHRTDRYHRWMRWLVGYAVTATAALLLLAAPINRVMFDTQPGGTVLIRILALGLLLTVARLAMSFELIADGNERVVFASALVGASISVVGGLVVAGPFGAQGVAWMQLVGLVGAVSLLAVRRPEPTETSSPSGV